MRRNTTTLYVFEDLHTKERAIAYNRDELCDKFSKPLSHKKIKDRVNTIGVVRDGVFVEFSKMGG